MYQFHNEKIHLKHTSINSFIVIILFIITPFTLAYPNKLIEI